MSNQYIPKERLTAYERWEMAALDEAERMANAMREAEAVAAVPPAPPEPVAPAPAPAPEIDPAELALIRQQAFEEGRAAGHAEGYQAGHAEGLASGEAAAKAELAKLASLARNFSHALESSENQVADALLALAIDIAAQVIRTSLKIKPELMMPAVREAIVLLANPHGHPSLLLHPDDAALIREQLGEQLAHTGWRIFEDPQIARGGCRIENGGAEIDGTLNTRWRRVVENLGRQTDWLDTP